MINPGCVGAVVLTIVVFATVREAEACSPWDPELTRTFPASGGGLPEGAALVLSGHVLLPDLLTATVDGVPADLVLVPERSQGSWASFWGYAFETMALQIEPAPSLGQTIILNGNPCPQSRFEGLCDEVELVYAITEPDVDAPDAPLELYYDTYDHGNVATEHSSCGSTSAQHELTVHTEIGRDVLEFPLEYRILRRLRASEGAWQLVEHGWLLDEDANGPRIRWQWLPSELGGLLPLSDAFCLRFETADTSDNLGGALEICPPCHDQIGDENGQSLFAWPDAHPPYTDASIVPDGYCPEAVREGDTGGVEETGGEETGLSGLTDSSASGDGGASTGEPASDTEAGTPTGLVQSHGCGCASGRTAPPWLAAWMLFATTMRRRPAMAA